MEDAVSGEERDDKAAWKRSKPVHRAQRLLTLELFRRLQGLFGNNKLYVLHDGTVLEWSAVQKLYLITPSLWLVLATLGNEIGDTLQAE